MKHMARFVLMGNVLLPGGLQIGDPLLDGAPLMVEVPRKRGHPLPLDDLRTLRSMTGALMVEAGILDHREIIDLLMIEIDRACISWKASLEQLKLAHSLSSKIMTTVRVDPPAQMDAEMWVESELEPRLAALSGEVGRDLLVTSAALGAMAAMWGGLSPRVLCAFDWWLAPAEAREVELPGRPVTPRGWMIDGAVLLGVDD